MTCASRNSLPSAELSWYINGEKADKEFLRWYPEETNYQGLRTSRLGLSFKVGLIFKVEMIKGTKLIVAEFILLYVHETEC